MASLRARYVNPAAANTNGDGTTSATSSGDNTHAYKSVYHAIIGEDGSGDLVSDDVYLEIRCVGGSETDSNNNCAIDGFTTDATRYIHIKAYDDDDGEGLATGKHNGYEVGNNANTSGFRLLNMNAYGVRVYEDFVKFSDICIYNGSQKAIFGQSLGSSSLIEFDRCFVHNNHSIGTFTNSGTNNGGTIQLTNCVVLNEGTGPGIDNYNNYGSDYSLRHCTVATATSTDPVKLNSGNDAVRNTAAMNDAGTADIPTSVTYQTNVSDGTNHTQITATDEFESPVVDADSDYRLLASATSGDVQGAGTDLSITVDIIGNARTSSPSIGAFEVVAAGGATILPQFMQSTLGANTFNGTFQ